MLNLGLSLPFGLRKSANQSDQQAWLTLHLIQKARQLKQDIEDAEAKVKSLELDQSATLDDKLRAKKSADKLFRELDMVTEGIRRRLPKLYSEYQRVSVEDDTVRDYGFLQTATDYAGNMDKQTPRGFVDRILPLYVAKADAAKRGDTVRERYYRDQIVATNRARAGLMRVAPLEEFSVTKYKPYNTKNPTKKFFNDFKINPEKLSDKPGDGKKGGDGKPTAKNDANDKAVANPKNKQIPLSHKVYDAVIDAASTYSDAAVIPLGQIANETVPHFSYNYGQEVYPFAKEVSWAIYSTPTHYRNFTNRTVPMAINKVIAIAPDATDKFMTKAKDAATKAAISVAKRTGITLGGALAGAGLGLALSRGLSDDESGYDIPATVMGMGAGGLLGYYASSKDNIERINKAWKKYGNGVASVGSALGLGLAYRALAKKPTIAGTLLSGAAGLVIPAGVSAILKAVNKNKDK